jgi:CRP-like cAMP-binding protein
VSASVTVCHEGDPPGEVFLIERGSVRIVMSPPSGRELILSTRSAGQLVGEMSAFDGRPRSASVIANEPTTMFVIAAEVFLDAVITRPTLSSHFLAVLTEKLRAADDRTMTRTTKHVPTRLAARLVALSEAHLEHVGSPGEITLGIRQADLASWVGASREAVARVLADWREANVVRTGRGSLAVLDLAALRLIAHR